MQSITASLARRARLVQDPRTQPFVSSTFRTFSIQSRLRLKEDGDRSGEELDKKKHEQIEKQKQGKGHWHEELASSGEANVTADKEKVHDHDEHIEDLQKETAGQVEKDHPHGKAKH